MHDEPTYSHATSVFSQDGESTLPAATAPDCANDSERAGNLSNAQVSKVKVFEDVRIVRFVWPHCSGQPTELAELAEPAEPATQPPSHPAE